MAALDKIYLYRMTHIQNIPHILKQGITHIASAQANKNYIPIGDGSLIGARNHFFLNNGNSLGSYIPFYFGVRMPMLYVIQNGFNSVGKIHPENIVYCVTSIQKMIDFELDFVFTNGHAIDALSEQFKRQQVTQIEQLIDWKAVKVKFWNDENDLDLKRRKEAEFLVLGDLPINALLGYIVYNENAKNQLVQFSIPEKQIYIKKEYYF